MHRILERQIKKLFGENATFPLKWKAFITLVNDTYLRCDKKIKLLNESLYLSSKKSLEGSREFQEIKKEIEKSEGEKIESFEKYQTLINNLSIGVYRNTPGPQGHFLEANPAIISLFEADSKEEFLKHNVSDLYQYPEKRALFAKKLLKQGLVKDEELELITLKGKKITGSITAVMKKDKEGNIYFDGTIEDITERKRMEEALKNANEKLEIRVKKRTKDLDKRILELEEVRKAMTNLLEDFEKKQNELIESEKREENAVKDLEKFKLAVDNASDHIVITDSEGVVIYGNKAVEKITGYKPEEAIGKKSGVLWKSPMPLEYYQNFWNVIKIQKKTFTGEIQNKRKNGTIYTAIISVSPVLDKNGEIIYFVGTERDITAEKEIESVRKGFLSLASHQLRTPLSGTKWLIETMQRGVIGELNTKQKEYINKLYQINERMIRLVSDMLDVLLLEGGVTIFEKQKISVSKLFEELLSTMDPVSKNKSVILQNNFKNKKTLFITSNSQSLRNILECFVSNAINYSKVGDEIVLDAKEKPGAVVFSVKDNGIGIPKDEQKRMFERFYRASNAKEYKPDGTGLGLYTAFLLAQKVNGKITFESEENKGATFYLQVPKEVGSSGKFNNN
ncbi:MAG: PAS domain S-box protein [Candidatus Paceibacterota bacterium]